jgi:hypothetical protein
MPFPNTGPVKLSDVKNSVYTNETSYFLDKLSTKNKESASAAYSTRLVNSSYSGPAVNVRRASDNATQDFYADINGNLGTEYLAKGTTLDSWLGASNGYVTKIYDQTGNNRHVSQSTNANQPTIGPIHLLDAMSSAGKSATTGAYGLFRMNSSYTGPTIRIRRTQDNTESDFYADANGKLGTALNGTGTPFQSWIQNSTAFVRTWYDQSGNGFHCQQSDNGLQPVYAYETGVIDFSLSGGNKYFLMGNTAGPMPTGPNPNYTVVFKHGIVDTYHGCVVASGLVNSNNNHNGIIIYNTADGWAYLNYWWFNDHTWGQYIPGNTITIKHDGTTQTTYLNNLQQNTSTRSGLHVSTAQQYMGCDGRFGGTYLNGQLYYVCIMNTAISDADRNILHQYEPEFGYIQNAYNPFKYDIFYNGSSSRMELLATTVGCEYPPPGSITANTTNVTGRTYGNGTYICSASSTFANTGNFYLAFGGETWWESAANYDFNSGNNNGTYSTSTTNMGTLTGDWVQIQMPVSIAVRSFSFGSTIYDGTVRAPRRFGLLGSTNGSTWKCIHYDSGITDWLADGRPKYFITNIDNTSTFNYFRLVVSEMGNSYTGTGVNWQNVTDVSMLKFNPATPLTRGSMEYTYLLQCSPRDSMFAVVCEQHVAIGSTIVSNERASLIMYNSGLKTASYFAGQNNDTNISREGPWSHRNIVMICNHNKVGGAAQSIHYYDNGILTTTSSANPTALKVSVGGFYIGSRVDGVECFHGSINEVIVVNDMLTPGEALLYNTTRYPEMSNRIMPLLKPKHMINFDPMTPNNVPSDTVVKCSVRELSPLRHNSRVFEMGDFYMSTYTNRPLFRIPGHTNGPYGSVTNSEPFVQFDSASSHHLTASSRTFNIDSGGGFTAIMCVKRIGTLNANSRFFDFGSGGPNNNILCGMYVTGTYFQIYNGSTNILNVNVEYLPPVDQWFVICCKYTKSTNRGEIFFNGIRYMDAAASATPTDRTVNNTYIGRSGWSGDPYPNYYTTGLYAYARSLSDTEVAAVSNALLYPNVYGVPRSITTRYSNVTHSGKLFSHPIASGGLHTSNVVTAPVSPNTFGSFSNWNGDFVAIDDVPALPISIAFWVNCINGGGYQTFCSITERSRTNPIVQMDWAQNDGRLGFFFALPGWWTDGLLYNISPDTWYHIAVTISPNYIGKVYINGSLEKTITGSGLDWWKGRNRIIIGSNGDGGPGSTRGFYGRLSDFRIYDMELRQDEITNISNANYYRNNFQIGYTNESNFLVNRNNWTQEMTFVQYGNYGNENIDSGPYLAKQIGRSDIGSSLNQYYHITAIQNYDSFTASFDILTSSAVADGLYFFCGGTAPQPSSGTLNYTNYGASGVNAYVINFQIYNGNVQQKPGVYLLSNFADKTTVTHNGLLAYNGNTQWLGSNRFIPVTIKYTRGSVNTWVINVNGQDVITYNDHNNAYWRTVAGNYWGIGSYIGGATANVVFRSVELSYTPTDSQLSVSSIVPRGIGMGASVRDKSVPGLIPGFTWKFYDYIANAADVIQIPRSSMTSNTTTYSGSTHYDGTYIASASNAHGHSTFGGPHVAFNNTNDDQYNVWGIAGYNWVTGVYEGSTSTTVSGVAQAGEWIQIQVPNPIVLYSFTLRFWWPNQSYWPKSFVIAASNDGSTWTNIYSTTTASFTYSVNQTFVTTGDPVPYRYFRLISRQNSGGPGACDFWILDQWILNTIPMEANPYRSIGRSSSTFNMADLTNAYVPDNNSAASHLVFAEGWFLANQTGTWTFTTTNSGGYTHLYINGNILSTGGGGNISMTKGTYYRINMCYGKNSGSGAGSISFTPPGGSSTSNWRGYIFSSTGTNSSFPAESAKVIKDITNTNTDGVYHIRLNGIGTATYCLMNDCYDGGGWMLLMKAARGMTFNYSSNYWTTANTLNPSDTTRTDGDSKFDAFNYGYIKDVMAIFPDIPSKSYTNVIGKTGGSLDLQDGWCWKVDNWNGNSRTTALAGFQVSRDVLACPSPDTFTGFSTSLWSYNTSSQRHVFGGGSHLSASLNTRWGFLWNNEANQDFTSCDLIGGIGLNTGVWNSNYSFSAGDVFFCCGTANVNRSMRLELWGR